MTAFLPELILLAVGVAILGTEVIRIGSGRSDTSVPYHLAWAGLMAVLAALVLAPAGAASFGGYGASGALGPWKSVFAAAALGTVLLSRSYFLAGGSARGILDRPGAFYGLIAMCTFGMFALVSARDLLTFYLGLELATLPLYALAAFQPKDTLSAEAGSKYILFGGLASALSLFGISLLYGACGGLRLDVLAVAADADPSNPLLGAGVFFLLGGLGFKLSMAPLHMWAPDVYEGAPTPVTAFLSVASKAAAVGAVVALFFGPLDPLRGRLEGVFASAAVLSMAIGNLGALRQKNLRRFVAYSSIAQVGYMLLAFMAEAGPAREALLYNLVVYGVSSFALFFVMAAVGRDRLETLDSLRGLSRRNPALAALLALAMFSLAGIPPLAGFLGKFLLFSTIAAEGRYVLVTIAVANAVVSFYYYMQLVKQAYITVPEGPMEKIRLRPGSVIWLGLLAAALLVLGLCPVALRYLQAALAGG